VCDDERPASKLVVPCNVDFAGQDDDDARAHTPDGDDCLTRMIGADLAESAHALDVFRIQDRKHLVASRIDDRARGKGHLLARSNAVRSA
jgi:hypothetical protein